MSYYLIGIGGTGARCIESFIHLTGAGLLKDSQEVNVIYIDADVSCGNLLRTQSAANAYEKACKVGRVDNNVFANNIVQYEAWNPVGDESEVMDNIFQRMYMLEGGEAHKGLGMLYDALFTEQERRTNLDKGFRGHPAIGAAIMNRELSDKKEPWATIMTKMNSDKDAKVFLMGSVFGGTGAAGFPTIAKLLKKYLKKDENGKCIAKISGALILPYFQFPQADDDERNEMQAKVDEFMLNTKAALEYYNDNKIVGDVFTSIYTIGDNELNEVKSFSLGSNTQKNEPHFIELYAGLAAMDFFNKKEYEIGEVNMIGRGSEDNNKITWEDLPNICVNGTLHDKLSTFIKYLYMYRVGVYPSLEAISKDQSKERYTTWYLELSKKSGGIDVYNDRDMMNKFENLSDYTEIWFKWFNDIISNHKRKIELIDPSVYEEAVKKCDYKFDASCIILPKAEGKNKLERDNFWKKLSQHRKDSQTATGAAVLMNALYDIAK